MRRNGRDAPKAAARSARQYRQHATQRRALKRSRWFAGEQKNIICRQLTIGPLDAEGDAAL